MKRVDPRKLFPVDELPQGALPRYNMPPDPDPKDVLRRFYSAVNSAVGCSMQDLLGQDLYRDVQIVMYGGYEEEEEDDGETDAG